MTEDEWLSGTDVRAMLESLGRTLSERKARLFAVACCRPELFRDPRSLRVLEVAERHADGLAGDDEWMEIGSLRMDVEEPGRLGSAVYWAAESDVAPAFFASRASFYARSVSWEWLGELSAEEQEQAWDAIDEDESQPELGLDLDGPQADLLREIVGNPFRPAAFDPAWLRPEVTSLAQAIYEDRAFGRMPELAAHLERAGCTDRDILDHCRRAGGHVRSCWVLDAVLARR
ncbi:hypothetical protein OJF2_40970 [Aquisphaera giovannonii]|uniref:SMI1/KNR4 family protein n=1 Tax=Aquisphaera giovannonii TaxID=406548 RepID=A0A5B9W5R8_9BACT|nr:hypothetical protein [Aquisphaera giovannonii]QEH35544.1 hypothetical protein OJF2_40970 [Aquisphaera giovannonii]